MLESALTQNRPPTHPCMQESAEAKAQALYEGRRLDEAALARRAAREEAVQVRPPGFV